MSFQLGLGQGLQFGLGVGFWLGFVVRLKVGEGKVRV